MLRQYDRFMIAYNAMVADLGELQGGLVSEIIYLRNIQEYSESETGNYARCTIKYVTPETLISAGYLSYDPETFRSTPWKLAHLYFYENRTVVKAHTLTNDYRRHKKNRHIATEKTVMDETGCYDGYMHSEVVRKAIRRNNLQTFLKIGDINEWEDTESVF